jgi:tripartite-type tricarboxylate transporter receptor subunit TctC
MTSGIDERGLVRQSDNRSTMGAAMPSHFISRGVLVALTLWLAMAGAQAQQPYPSQTVKIIVGVPAGAITDLVARIFAKHLTDLGKTAIVENRPGATGVIAAEMVAKSPHDGYTLFMATHATNSIMQHLQKLPYDPISDFSPVILLVTTPNTLIVTPSLPVNSVKEFIAYAKARPGKLSYASQGVGSSGHIVAEQFKAVAGVDLAHVPYRGAAPALQDVVAGHVPVMFDVVALTGPLVARGKVKALAVAAPQRAPTLPDGPTLAVGGVPGVAGGAWFGLRAPAGTPQAVVDWLNAEGNKAFKVPEVHERLVKRGLALPLGSPADFAAFIAADSKRYGDIIRKAGIKIESH